MPLRRRAGRVNSLSKFLEDVYASPTYIAQFQNRSLCNFSSWLISVVVVEFDTSEGHKILLEYPPEALSESEKSRLTHISLPDSRSTTTLKPRGGKSRVLVGEPPNWLGFRFRRDSCLPLDRSSIAEQTFALGAAFFRSVGGDSYRRGARQESLVVLSPLPTRFFFSVVLPVTLYLGKLYFRYGFNVIYDLCACVAASWPPPSHWNLSQPIQVATRYVQSFTLFLNQASAKPEANSQNLPCSKCAVPRKPPKRVSCYFLQRRRRVSQLRLWLHHLVPWLCSCHPTSKNFFWTPQRIVAVWGLLSRNANFERRRLPHQLTAKEKKRTFFPHQLANGAAPSIPRSPSPNAEALLAQTRLSETTYGIPASQESYQHNALHDARLMAPTDNPLVKKNKRQSFSTTQTAFFAAYRKPRKRTLSLSVSQTVSGNGAALCSDHLSRNLLSPSCLPLCHFPSLSPIFSWSSTANLVTSLGPLTECVWVLWELLLSESPLLIIAGDSMRASSVGFNILRLISPLEYAADHR